ncbi:hypothetical protein [Helicobacter cappadocius]|uniref:Motility integral membrane protein n=1 Tax=Helicobacter cappadocius TaxID=3063998 RepID=A0AA90Q1M5_9HELI|nr:MULTISPECIES: hypothetical protein [unclassified Helicobacter]MDO7252661.1 hypothetical protein [Helicobacter sp. faydin-H75]MDP2538528.1 hypothetical protein [Helicobacter sp. faydin-H76]
MKPNNYINFSVVFGFFLGLAFSIAKFDRPEIVLFWTIVSTLGFYLIVVFCASVYIWFLDFDKRLFNKEVLEKRLDYFDHEFDIREKEASNIRQYIRNSDFLDINSSSGEVI